MGEAVPIILTLESKLLYEMTDVKWIDVVTNPEYTTTACFGKKLPDSGYLYRLAIEAETTCNKIYIFVQL